MTRRAITIILGARGAITVKEVSSMRSLALVAIMLGLCSCATKEIATDQPVLQNAVYVVGDNMPLQASAALGQDASDQPSTLKRSYWFFAGR